MTFLLLGLSFLDSFGQEHHYWAYGKKHPMQVLPEKYFVLVDSKQSKNGLLSVLGGDATGISEMANVEITSIIRRNLKDSTDHEELSWAIVEGRFNQSVENHEEILYASPFFTVNGKEIGLSQFFFVELDKTEDYALLEDFARENNVVIVGQDSFMPLWYVLSCNKMSKGNAMEMANKFHETGKFKNAQPDLMEEL